MTSQRLSLDTLALLLVGFVLGACGGGAPPPETADAAQAPAAEAAPEPATARTDSAQPASAQPEAPRALIGARFQGITADGFPQIELTNLSDRDIETVSGAYLATNAEGKQVWGTGLTVAVPGQTFLAAGASRIATPFGLNKKPEMMETLRNAPESLTFSFTVREITYVGD